MSILTWKSYYFYSLGEALWSLSAKQGYKPGYINEVYIKLEGTISEPTYRLYYTDGYKTNLQYSFESFGDAEIAAIDLMIGRHNPDFKAHYHSTSEFDVIRPQIFGAARLKELAIRNIRLTRELELLS